MSDFSSSVQSLLSSSSSPATNTNSSYQFSLSGVNLNSGNTAGGIPTALGGLGGSLTSQTVNAISGAASGAVSSVANLVSQLGGTTAGTASNNPDFRVRIRAQTAAQQKVYGAAGSTNILNILYNTNGMFFPYTPTISWNQSVEYDAMHFVHSNQDFYAYKNTPSTVIDISGQFTVQNQREGEYLLASMHLLRTVSKMYFGQQNKDLAGLPPPIMLLSGYGNYMFNDLPVIVKSHSYTFDNNVDYVTITTAGGSARLPALLTMQVQVIVQNTPNDLRTKFDLDQFRTGALMRNSTGWI
jgi:hypothetical protein